MIMPSFLNLLETIGTEVSGELPLITLRTFLFVGSRGQVSQKEVEEHLNCSNAAASRNISYWTDRRFDRNPGMDMMVREVDDYDRRVKVVKLNRKGREFYERIRKAMEK